MTKTKTTSLTADPVVLPEPVYTMRVNGRMHSSYTPTMSAFDLEDGEHKLYTEQQVRALLATATGLPAQAYQDSTPQLHVGESSFEGWYAGYVKEGTVSLKQNCRDAYAAGMGDPLVAAAPQAQADARDAEQERWMEIGKAIERVCIDLPDSTEIVIALERDAGTVTMFDPDGNEHDQFSHEDGFAGVVNAAIDAAKAAAQGGEHG